MTMYLTKEQLRQASRPEPVPLEIPELGGALALRAVPIRDQVRINDMEDTFLRVVEFLRCGIVNPENGGPLYESRDEFLEVLDGWPPAVFVRTGNRLHELSGTAPGTVERLQGNLPETPSEDSPTSSPGSSA